MENIPQDFVEQTLEHLKVYVQNAAMYGLDIHRMPPQMMMLDLTPNEGFSFQKDLLVIDDIPLEDWKKAGEENKEMLHSVGYIILCVVGTESDQDDFIFCVLNLASATEFFKISVDGQSYERAENPDFLPCYMIYDSH